jgi:multidrug efflux pump
MVLAIGIIVDDAIVVVENVERLMAEEGLSPREATSRAMREITGAVIGITLVLSAVFIPMAFASGTVGAIYRQFTLSMAVSILFSAFLALSLTPALCATLLKPVDGHARKARFFVWFDRSFDRLSDGYLRWVALLLRHTGRAMLGFAVIVGLLGLGFSKLPTSFLPEDDQGFFMTLFQLPTDATTQRTFDMAKRYEDYVKTRPGLKDNEIVMGFGFAGSGPNVAMAFTMLKDWGHREGATAAGEVAQAMEGMAGAREGTFMALMPPAIEGLGTSAGFSLRLEDRANQGNAALVAAQNQLLGLAAQSKLVTGVYPENLPSSTSVRLEIDRRKAQALGVPFPMITDTLTAAMGSRYVNDFPNAGRMQQVIVQADAPFRMQISDLMGLYVRNNAGAMVRLSEVVNPVWGEMPLQLTRYNGYPSTKIAGAAAPGVSSGEAMAEMERLGAQLPKGFALEWTGQSFQEQQAGAEAPMLLALSMLVVFLVLAALYESWSIPLSVMLVVPLGLIGAFAAVLLRGLPNDVFFKVGMITIIGLSAKNAILIVEFAKQYREEGMSAVDAALAASRVRLRPILMTSLAFTLGVVPLVLARGASAETQNAIGTGVFGGMISGTLLAVLLVPVFYVVVTAMAGKWKERRSRPAAAAQEA